MIEVKWANPEQNIVIWEFSAPWIWNEFFTAKQEVDTMIDEVEGIVDSIFLTSVEQRIPSGAPRNFKKIISERHPRHDIIALVGSRMLLMSLVNIALKITPSAKRQFHFVNSETEAYAIIAEAQKSRQKSPVSNAIDDTA